MKSNNEGLKKEYPTGSSETSSLPQDEASSLRQQFINEILQIINVNSDQPLPMGMKPVLSGLLVATDQYLDQQIPEASFLAIYQDTLTILSKGWSSYSQWVAAEQITCYTIFWGLKTALEKHLHRLGLSVQDLQLNSSFKSAFWEKVKHIFKKISVFFNTYDFEYYQWGNSFKALDEARKEEK